MKNLHVPKRRAAEWESWGRPTEILIDLAREFESAPLRQALKALAVIENRGSCEIDTQS